jgi:hypothetical protein
VGVAVLDEDAAITDPYERAERHIERARAAVAGGKAGARRTASVESMAALTEALFAVAKAIDEGTARIAEALVVYEEPPA